MKKILFTDLYDTLIVHGENISKKYYNSREKEIDIVTYHLNDFLMDNNYVVIVTSPAGHKFFGDVFNNTFVAFHTRIDESLRSKITYYTQGHDGLRPKDNIIKKNINGKIYYFGNHEVSAMHVDRKEDAITDFLQNIQPPYQVYAVGDSAMDIPMLLRAQELGGESSFIDMSFYRQDITTDEIIENELHVEFHLEFHRIHSNQTIEDRMNGIMSDELISLCTKREQRKLELYKLLYEGKLDLERLNKNYRNFINCSDYKVINDLPNSVDYVICENYPFSENLVKNVVNIALYPSFTDYYTKVLKK